ncbi:MAG: TrkH family potassium uptake protein [Planctomycetales bacterium]|nr:TrkH family potassium uptake protein [Planctomycetales bacterium]
MNHRLVFRLLGTICWLIGLTMAFSLPFAWPSVGSQTEFEARGFYALIAAIVISAAIGLVLRNWGRGAPDTLYRKEAMAIVGLSWVLATILGAIPYLGAGVVYNVVDGVEQPMGIADSLFESQSGFSTTGATVLTDIENEQWVPRCILFWRSSTHFLGGLGIIVLFVAVLGQGSAGKALMRTEMPGPKSEGSHERMQHTAWIFAAIYCGLNLLLTLILKLEGMTWFEAICHAFGTMATGGFSTLNASLGGFESKAIEYTVIVFMLLAGTNFTLLYFILIRKPGKFLGDPEWRTYMTFVAGSTLLVMAMGIWVTTDFDLRGDMSASEELEAAFRDGLFQVVSIITTTGFGTADFDLWNSFSKALLIVLMFVGGCAGSTGGGMKVIRHILFIKILRREIEHSYRPSVVRHIRLNGEPLTDPDLPHSILVYFGLIALIFTASSQILVGIEPDSTWVAAGQPVSNKLVDSASAVAATMHNIGPGIGIVGPTRNYALFSAPSKLLFTFLMMLGRLELFAILVLMVPSFWRDR